MMVDQMRKAHRVYQLAGKKYMVNRNSDDPPFFEPMLGQSNLVLH